MAASNPSNARPAPPPSDTSSSAPSSSDSPSSDTRPAISGPDAAGSSLNDPVDEDRIGQAQRDSPIAHWVFLTGSCAVILASFLMRHEGESEVYLPGTTVPIPGICTFRNIFKIDCPGCGLTRSFINISQRQWGLAWQLNPAAFPIYLFLLFQIPWQATQLFRHYTQRRQLRFPVPWVFVSLLVIALLAQWLAKMVQSILG